MWAGRAALGTLLCLAGCVGCLALSIALYPGGTWLEPTTIGHRFFQNYFCDLTQPRSLSGTPNPLGSRLAQVGMLFFAGALAGLFWIVPDCFTRHARLAWGVRLSGLFAVSCFSAVPLLPSQHFGELHERLALLAGALGSVAVMCAVLGLFAVGARALAALGGVALLAGLFDGFEFVAHIADHGPPLVLLPAAQKVAALLLGAWIAAVALIVLRSRARADDVA